MNNSKAFRIIQLSVIATFIFVCFFACSKTKDAVLPSLNIKDTTETLALLDSTSFGVYKGVVSVKGGSLKIVVNNGNSDQKAWLMADSLGDTLVCSDVLVAGEPLVNLLFTGRISRFLLSADDNGNEAVITDLSVSGIPSATAVVFHEKSTAPVQGYTASFTGSQRGEFNLAIQQNQLKAVAGYNGAAMKGNGLLVGSILQVTTSGLFGNIQFQGSIDVTKDYYSGTWNSGSQSGIFSGQRMY